MNNKVIKRIGGILINVVLYIFLALCIFSVIFTLFSKKDSDGAATILGMQMRLVLTESMEESEYTDVSGYDIGSIPKDSMVFIECVPEDEEEALEWYSELKVGDVLTVKIVDITQIPITHRIVKITEKYDNTDKDKDGNITEIIGYVFDLEGDNKAYSNQKQLKQSIDTTVDENLNYVVGKVRAKSVSLGFIINLLKEPTGMIFIVIVPCIAIIFLEVIKIFNAFSAEKKKKRAEDDEKKNNEIEELKRRLLELEMMKNQSAPTEPEPKPVADEPSATEPTPKSVDDTPDGDTNV